MSEYYEWFKAFHVIAMTAWMAGMFYLPRLFVYHCEVKFGSSEEKRFRVMEQRLLRVIMNPAMIVTIALGLVLVSIYGLYALGPWFHVKAFFVVLLAFLHGFFSVCRKRFAEGKNKHAPKFYRIINEVVTICFIVIVVMVIVKPFEG